ncbi:MAG: T9SS type A sorting domain-containing protein [Flavobacteriales bacterium]|nr:T9SS type A sorting domain-containing protein [Flavobacteriales bacterium]
MKNDLLISSFLIAAIFMVSSAFHTDNSAASVCDAPLIGGSLTGAPGENHCGTAGCHSGSVNNGPGTTVFDIGNGLTEYQTGVTYTVSIDIDQTGIDRFGFQVISLRDADNSYVGTYTLTDPINTRQINGGGGKKYVGSTACGSDASPMGSLGWTFDWNAPASDEGDVTFYLVSLATNHNHSASGDFTYTQSLQLSALDVTGISEAHAEKGFSMYPNPAVETVSIELPKEATSNKATLSILNNLGQNIRQEQLSGESVYRMDVSDLSEGVYFVEIATKNKRFTQQLIKK